MSVTDLKNIKVGYYQITEDVSMVHQIINALYQLNIQSVLVEGGAYLLQSFIDENLWDEARTLTAEHLIIQNGLPAPVLKNHQFMQTENIKGDVHRYFRHINNEFVL